MWMDSPYPSCPLAGITRKRSYETLRSSLWMIRKISTIELRQFGHLSGAPGSCRSLGSSLSRASAWKRWLHIPHLNSAKTMSVTPLTLALVPACVYVFISVESTDDLHYEGKGHSPSIVITVGSTLEYFRRRTP